MDPGKLRDFAEDSREVQIRVLAKLRYDASDDSGHLELSLYAIVIAVLATLFATVPAAPATASEDVTVRMLSSIVFAGIALAAVAPAMKSAAQAARARAAMWLGVFEEELERRRSGRGAAARAWRRTH